MSEIYQPLIIRELLRYGGVRSKQQLAMSLAQSDVRVVEYYKGILMRHPKATLTKHKVLEYDKHRQNFRLVPSITESAEIPNLIELCDTKIEEWISKKNASSGANSIKQSLRYLVLKKAKGRCELCGVPTSMSAIDIDHIVPQSRADKNGKVEKDGRLIPVHSEENLQALCFRCNRAKRDTDETDFRRVKTLVRDRFPEQTGSAVRVLKGRNAPEALDNQLMEEHAKYIYSGELVELVDMLEVIFSIGERKGLTREGLLKQVEDKRKEQGGYEHVLQLG